MLSKCYSYIVLCATVILSSCCLPPMLDFAGRGCPDNCLYLDTKSMTIVYDCRKEKIDGIRVFIDGPGKQHYACDERLEEPVLEHVLSLSKDSMRNKTISIWVSITNTHWREHSVITVRPGNLDKTKTIKARYFSH
jgi:hypothetical protein